MVNQLISINRVMAEFGMAWHWGFLSSSWGSFRGVKESFGAGVLAAGSWVGSAGNCILICHWLLVN